MPRYHDDNIEFLQGLRDDLFKEALDSDIEAKPEKALEDRKEKLEKALHYFDHAVHLNKVLKYDAKNAKNKSNVNDFKERVKEEENLKEAKTDEKTEKRFKRIERCMDIYMSKK